MYESPCFFEKKIWSLLFGRTKSQALSQIQWAMKWSVKGNEMEW